MEMKLEQVPALAMEWRKKKSTKPKSEKIIEFIIKAGGYSSIFLILAILFFILKESFPFLVGRFDFVEFFTSTAWNPASVSNVTYGILALFVGTLLVTVISMFQWFGALLQS
jgi:ABC-type phosphate transport system permease subunit